MDFRYRLMQFMSGRYGMDNLSVAIIFTAGICSVINIFIGSRIVQLVVYLLLFLALFRMLSRNIEVRRRENNLFNEKVGFIKRKKQLYVQRKNDRCHVYKKCPSCKAVLRLPHRIGEHTTVCPRCNKQFKVKVKK